MRASESEMVLKCAVMFLYTERESERARESYGEERERERESGREKDVSVISVSTSGTSREQSVPPAPDAPNKTAQTQGGWHGDRRAGRAGG